ncbi:hypothetical protein GJ496_006411, partial [Pomphorhynchus laevis]
MFGREADRSPDEKTMMTGTEERSDVRSAATGSSKARKGSKRKSKSDRKRSKKVGRKENMNGKSASSEKNDIKLTNTGVEVLGCPIGSAEYEKSWLGDKIENWMMMIQRLAEIAKIDQQLAYSAYMVSLQHKWTHIFRACRFE